jgi:hypothetical protein
MKDRRRVARVDEVQKTHEVKYSSHLAQLEMS